MKMIAALSTATVLVILAMAAAIALGNFSIIKKFSIPAADHSMATPPSSSFVVAGGDEVNNG